MHLDPPVMPRHETLGIEYMHAWTTLDIEMALCVNDGIVPPEVQYECLVTLIPAPSLRTAVAEAVYRWRIETASRGIDSDFTL